MKTNFAIAAVFLYVVFLVMSVIGWVMNLLTFIHMLSSSSPVTGMFLVRLVGIPVFVIGAILGWF